MDYYTRRRVDAGFDETVERVMAALADEGFGILCDIDVRATFAEKLGLDDYPGYRILGACNPELGRDGLDAERDLGVLLPCNVAIYEDEDGVVVSAVEPETLMSVVENPALDDIAADVRGRLDRVLDAVAE